MNGTKEVSRERRLQLQRSGRRSRGRTVIGADLLEIVVEFVAREHEVVVGKLLVSGDIQSCACVRTLSATRVSCRSTVSRCVVGCAVPSSSFSGEILSPKVLSMIQQMMNVPTPA
jgi:uncharacterized protein YgbK (DUF1537 family)